MWILIVGAMSVYGWQEWPIGAYKDAPDSVKFATPEACQTAGISWVAKVTGNGPATWEYDGHTLPIASYRCEPL
jgi:hypothetical protein